MVFKPGNLTVSLKEWIYTEKKGGASLRLGHPNVKRLRLRRGGIDKVVQGDGKENQKSGVLQAKWRKGSRGDIEQQCQILLIGQVW